MRSLRFQKPFIELQVNSPHPQSQQVASSILTRHAFPAAKIRTERYPKVFNKQTKPHISNLVDGSSSDLVRKTFVSIFYGETSTGYAS